MVLKINKIHACLIYSKLYVVDLILSEETEIHTLTYLTFIIYCRDIILPT